MEWILYLVIAIIAILLHPIEGAFYLRKIGKSVLGVYTVESRSNL